jgi:hypothetical protein
MMMLDPSELRRTGEEHYAISRSTKKITGVATLDSGAQIVEVRDAKQLSG